MYGRGSFVVVVPLTESLTELSKITELSKARDLTLCPRKDFLQDRLQAEQARKVLSKNSSVPSSNCSTMMVQVAGSSVPRGQAELSQVSESAIACAYASLSCS